MTYKQEKMHMLIYCSEIPKDVLGEHSEVLKKMVKYLVWF